MEPNLVINKPFGCTICQAKFSRKAYLDAHKRTHTGEKPFQCMICTKLFSQKSSLNTHKKIHTGERSFACDVCDKRFANKSYLTAHRRIHDTKKLESSNSTNSTILQSNANKCYICNRSFLREKNLIIHQNRKHQIPLPNNVDNSINPVREIRFWSSSDNQGPVKLSIVAEEISKLIALKKDSN